MAGDWIKMRTDLHDDPSVVGMSVRISCDTDLIVGKLHRIWAWADKHTTDGIAHHISYDWVDKYVSLAGFAQSMEAVGWLSQNDGCVVFPYFERHNGETAKRRADDASRKRASRKCPGDVRKMSKKSVTRGEDKRGEERRGEERTEEGGSSLNGESLTGSRVPVPVLQIDWRKATAEAGRIHKVVPRTKPEDRSIVLKSCALVQLGHLSENCLQGAVESTAKATGNRGAYFTTAIRGRADECHGIKNLDALLVTVVIPPEVLQ